MEKYERIRRAELVVLGGFVLVFLGFGSAFGGMPGNPLWWNILTSTATLGGIGLGLYGFVLHARAKRAGGPNASEKTDGDA
jgi:hypothetical protein